MTPNPFHPYAPRPIRALGTRNSRGFTLKAYAVDGGFAPFDAARFDGGIALAEEALPAPAVAPGRPGVGFLILHQGRGDYAVLGWWDRENELPLRVFVRHDGEAWRAAQASESVCVWDLEVLWREREAYVRTVLAGGSVDDYLARVFETG